MAHASERPHEEVTAGHDAMPYAATREELEARHMVFTRKWRLRHRAVADSLRATGPLDQRTHLSA